MTVSGTAVTGIDPVTFEIIRQRLNQVMHETVIALENVSGSPITNEGHDTMAALYTPDGEIMVGGVGFLHHLPSAAQAVKHVIELFSEDPGIDEDDAYFFNDSYAAAMHTSDVYIISPIHHEGVLRGYVANFVHMTDIGAIQPGGFAPAATENYQEGFQTQGVKIVEGGKLRSDIVGTFLNMVRDPGMTQLDLKSQLAANHVAKTRMRKLYDDYGVDVIETVAHELIRQSEELVRQRLRELPDGVWRARQYLDHPDETYRVELTATKTGDELTYDFTGSSPQIGVGLNCCYWATWGSLFSAIFPLLAWDTTWNEGVMRPFSMVAPEGSIVNCQRPSPTSLATVNTVQIGNNLSTIVLSKMLAASERYRDRATAVCGQHAHLETHGVDAEGNYVIVPLTDTFSAATGARSWADGVDVGGDIANMVARIANVESQELITPLRYIYRRVVPDSGGPGKYRGGMCEEYGVVATGGEEHPLGVVLFGKGVRAPTAVGVAGGYPGCTTGYHQFRGANVAEVPGGLHETRADAVENVYWGEIYLSGDDVQYVRFAGGGGYGDPLDREAPAVVTDVQKGLVSVEAARDIYGVVLDAARALDDAATRSRRHALREQRRGGSVDAKLVDRQPVAPTGERISEYLQRGAAGQTQCTWCGGDVAPAGADWKDHAVLARRPLSAAGPLRPDGDEFTLIEAYCPTCATLLDIDLALAEDPPLHDRIHSWPSPLEEQE